MFLKHPVEYVYVDHSNTSNHCLSDDSDGISRAAAAQEDLGRMRFESEIHVPQTETSEGYGCLAWRAFEGLGGWNIPGIENGNKTDWK